MKVNFQQARDLILIVIGALTILADFTLAASPDPTIVLGALGFLFSPLFLNRDEKT